MYNKQYSYKYKAVIRMLYGVCVCVCICVCVYPPTLHMYCSHNAEVLQSHPHILTTLSDELYGVMEGFVNTR